MPTARKSKKNSNNGSSSANTTNRPSAPKAAAQKPTGQNRPASSLSTKGGQPGRGGRQQQGQNASQKQRQRQRQGEASSAANSNNNTSSAPYKHKCMAGLPKTKELIDLRVPYGNWVADTLITDVDGNPLLSILETKHNPMGSFEIIFGDENGNKIGYVKRRLITNFALDGWDFCTYKPNFINQPKYTSRDIFGTKVYPHSTLSIEPMKSRYEYHIHKPNMKRSDDDEPTLVGMDGWLGMMIVCCTPAVRHGNWALIFHQPGVGDPEIYICQRRNLLQVEAGNDLLASLCIAYAFDMALQQPMVTNIGYEEADYDVSDDEDDGSGKGGNTTTKKVKKKKVVKKK